MKTYLVGGAVRDRLLGLPVKDKDWVVVGAKPQTLIAAGFQQVGGHFPVFLHPHTHEEYALARTERKAGSGHTGFNVAFGPEVTLAEDLMRRDLTINAIAEDDRGRLIDPYGGQDDLNNRLLRHVSSAFIEDPLRVLRVARFQARFAHLGFRIAEETLSLMQRMAKTGDLSALTAERVWQEMNLALTEISPAEFFRTLRQVGALAIILPELDSLFGIPQEARHYAHIDTGIHSLLALESAAQISADADVRLAALCCGLGKASTPKYCWPTHGAYSQAGAELVKRMMSKYRWPKKTGQLIAVATRFHLIAHNALNAPAESILDLLKGINAYHEPERLLQFLLVCEADYKARYDRKTHHYPQREHLLACLAASQPIAATSGELNTLSGSQVGKQIDKRRMTAIMQLSQSRPQG